MQFNLMQFGYKVLLKHSFVFDYFEYEPKDGFYHSKVNSVILGNLESPFNKRAY